MSLGSGYEPRHRQEQKLNVFIIVDGILQGLKVLSREKLKVDYKFYITGIHNS